MHKTEKEKGESGKLETAALAESVHLTAYRNYRSLSLRLAPGFNVLSGLNAQGKTNFLEALAFVSTTRLLRGRRDSEAILEGEDQSKVELELGRTRIGMQLERGGRKKAFLNGMSLPRAADLIGRFPCCCVTSFDLAMVRGEPSDRRLFLDLELSALYPAYLRHLTEYKRALEHRNALIRHSGGWVTPEAFEPWEAPLAEHGSALRSMRLTYLQALLPTAQVVHREMGQGETLDLVYAPGDESTDSESLAQALFASRQHDLHRGGTSVGPHRDDVLLKIDGREAKHFGSQGQQRTAVIAVKLGCLDVAREILGMTPILLLDDILSDLDAERRALLVEAVLARAGQAVLTCTEASAAGPRILSQAALFEVHQGEIRGV
jgi:DNA replication and repair protein RecF